LEQHRRRSLSPLDYHKTIPSEKGHKILHKIRSCGSINTWRVAEKCRSSPKTGVGKPSLDDERHFSKARTSSNNAFAYELALWTKNSNIMQRRASLLKERMEADPFSLSAAATFPASSGPSPVRKLVRSNLVHSMSGSGLADIDWYDTEDSTSASFCRSNESTSLPRNGSYPVLSSLDANDSQHVKERPTSLPPRNPSYKVLTNAASIRKVPAGSTRAHRQDSVAADNTDRFLRSKCARRRCSVNDDQVQCSVFSVGMLLMLVTISGWIAFLYLL
jgi:hypothetical protein